MPPERKVTLSLSKGQKEREQTIIQNSSLFSPFSARNSPLPFAPLSPRTCKKKREVTLSSSKGQRVGQAKSRKEEIEIKRKSSCLRLTQVITNKFGTVNRAV